MELLFVIVIAAGIGAIARYTVPGRHAYGVLLVPALAAAVAAGTWTTLLWLGLSFDGGWIWVASIAAATAVSVGAAVALPPRRERGDARMLDELLSRKA